MLIEVKVPALSESVADATLMTWHKKVGDSVRRDENLVDLETDKVVLEIVAPNEGVIKEIARGEGELVISGEVIATIDSAAKPAEDKASTKKAVNEVAISKSATEAVASDEHADVLLSPAARKLAVENNIDPSQITGSGRDQRVTKADILQYLESRTQRSSEPTEMPSPPLSSPPSTSLSSPVDLPEGERLEKRVAMSRLRARVAERLKDAQNTAAILTKIGRAHV